MTNFPPDLEALMPEPAHIVRALVHTRDETCVNYFTADQVRAAILGATERAAKLCEQQADDHTTFKNTQAAIGCDGCAAAIRGAEKEGAKGS